MADGTQTLWQQQTKGSNKLGICILGFSKADLSGNWNSYPIIMDYLQKRKVNNIIIRKNDTDKLELVETLVDIDDSKIFP